MNCHKKKFDNTYYNRYTFFEELFSNVCTLTVAV